MIPGYSRQQSLCYGQNSMNFYQSQQQEEIATPSQTNMATSSPKKEDSQMSKALTILKNKFESIEGIK